MIHWNVDPEIFRIGSLAPRWYGISFILGFLIGEKYCSRHLMNEQGFTKDEVSKLLYYMIFGTIIGARLGHCLFYEPGYYLSNPLEMLMVWKGGLASHGGFIGVAIAVFLFNKKVKQISYMWLLDLVAAPSLMTGGFIRLGNLMNSEILGKPTDVPWAFVFQRADNIPRHPAQLYESLGFLIISFVGYFLYEKFSKKWQPGRFIGYIVTFGFLHRFIVEFFKENQVPFEQGMFLNMGQVLSIPLILLGIFLCFYKSNKQA